MRFYFLLTVMILMLLVGYYVTIILSLIDDMNVYPKTPFAKLLIPFYGWILIIKTESELHRLITENENLQEKSLEELIQIKNKLDNFETYNESKDDFKNKLEKIINEKNNLRTIK